MDPLTITALASLAPTLLGMDWSQIFSGNKFSRDGWHGWSYETKERFVQETVDLAYQYAVKGNEYKGYSPKQIFWAILITYIHRDHEKTWDGWYSLNSNFQPIIDAASQRYGFPFEQPAPQLAIWKETLEDVFKNEVVWIGAGGLVALWIVSLIIKVVKRKK